MRTETATSAGGVVVDGDDILLISRRSLAGKVQWTLPKGMLEPGESPEETALREVREETGISTEILRRLGTIDYWFVARDEGARYHKFVHYFLMRPTGGDTADHDDEVIEVRWFPFAEAEALCAFENERDLIRTARAEAG